MKESNISLMDIRVTETKYLGRVTELSIFDKLNKNFHPDGLFSVEIFGAVGSKERNVREGIIELKAPVLHPKVYEIVTSLKASYKDLLAGKAFFKFDKKLKDFVPDEDGETGYAFFMRHLKDIRFKETGSDSRELKIRTVREHDISVLTMKQLVVLPAGLRDYVVKDDKPSEDEINGLYRNVLRSANMLGNFDKSMLESPVINTMLHNMQINVNAVYAYIKDIISDKSGFTQSSWASRSITYGTRNVISSLPSPVKNLDNKDVDVLEPDDTIVGVYQYLKAYQPQVLPAIKRTFISNIFDSNSDTVRLFTKDFKSVLKEVGYTTRDKWISDEGIIGLINKMTPPDYFDLPVTIDDHYIALLHEKDDIVTIILNSSEITEDMAKKDIRPLRYIDFFYLCIYQWSGVSLGLVTRYPVANLGGVYPSVVKIKTTAIGEPKYIRNRMTGELDRVYQFPIYGTSYVTSFSPHFSHLVTLGADFDGDKLNLTGILTDDAIKETKAYFKKASTYVKSDGTITYTLKNDVLDLTLAAMTKTL